MFDLFSKAVMEWSAILGLCVIVGSVIFTAYKIVTK